MSKFYDFNIESVKRKLISEAVPIMQKACDELYLEIQKNSPVDTGYYLSKHRKKEVVVKWNTVVAEVENMSDYPERVEDWFRQKAVNWHLQKWEIYYSQGADTYKKSVRKVWERFINNLK